MGAVRDVQETQMRIEQEGGATAIMKKTPRPWYRRQNDIRVSEEIGVKEGRGQGEARQGPAGRRPARWTAFGLRIDQEALGRNEC